MAVLFGDSFVRSFTVENHEGDTVAVDSLVAARLYSSHPSTAVIDDDSDTSGIERVTSWSSGSAEHEQLISYSAITDPDPHSESTETYYEVVGFRFESAGDIVRVVRPFTIARPNSIQSRIDVTAAEFGSVESSIYNTDGTGLKSSTWVDAKITEASKHVLKRMESKDFDRPQIKGSDLNMAVKYWAVSLACLDLKWFDQFGYYKDLYEQIFESFPVRVDRDEDGLIAPDEKGNLSIIQLIR